MSDEGESAGRLEAIRLRVMVEVEKAERAAGHLHSRLGGIFNSLGTVFYGDPKEARRRTDRERRAPK